MKDLSSQFHVDWKYIQGSTLRDNGRSAGERGQVAWKVSMGAVVLCVATKAEAF